MGGGVCGREEPGPPGVDKSPHSLGDSEGGEEFIVR